MKKILAVAALMVLAGTSHAKDFYAGAAYGMTSLKISCAGASECDTDDNGPKVYGGLNLTPEIAIEGAFIDFGEAGYRVGATARATGDARAIVANLAFRHAFIPEFIGVLRLGVASVKGSGRITTASGSADVSNSELRPYYGIGIEYRIDKMWSAIGGLDYTRGEVGGVKGRLELYSIGAQANF